MKSKDILNDYCIGYDAGANRAYIDYENEKNGRICEPNYKPFDVLKQMNASVDYIKGYKMDI